MIFDPKALINTLALAGLTLTPRGDLIDVEGDVDTLTDDLIEVIRDHKSELLELLRSKPIERPRLGSFARPCPVRGSRLTECPYHTCGGALRDHGRGLYECRGLCGQWFQLLAPETGFVYVGDLGEEGGGEAVEWLM